MYGNTVCVLCLDIAKYLSLYIYKIGHRKYKDERRETSMYAVVNVIIICEQRLRFSDSSLVSLFRMGCACKSFFKCDMLQVY